MKIISTALTRPRISSGVVICTSVPRVTTLTMSAPPEAIFARYFGSGDLVLPLHSDRRRVIDEFTAVAANMLDDEARISEQLESYRSSDPQVLEERPYWSGVMMRDHRSVPVRQAMEIWSAHVLRYSRRDQLSANYAFRKAGITPRAIAIDAQQSWFHTWPVAIDRRTDVRVYGRSGAGAGGPRRSRIGARFTQPLRASARWLARLVQEQASIATATSTVSPAVVETPGGRRMHVNSRDERGRALIAAKGNLNPTSLMMWRELLATAEWTHIVDVGANYGEMLMAVALPQRAALTAIEPNLYVLPHLLRTIRESGLAVDVIAAAASDRVGTVALRVNRNWSGMSSVIVAQAAGARRRNEVHDVEAVTLEALVRVRGSKRRPPADQDRCRRPRGRGTARSRRSATRLGGFRRAGGSSSSCRR